MLNINGTVVTGFLPLIVFIFVNLRGKIHKLFLKGPNSFKLL